MRRDDPEQHRPVLAGNRVKVAHHGHRLHGLEKRLGVLGIRGAHHNHGSAAIVARAPQEITLVRANCLRQSVLRSEEVDRSRYSRRSLSWCVLPPGAIHRRARPRTPSPAIRIRPRSVAAAWPPCVHVPTAAPRTANAPGSVDTYRLAEPEG